MPSQQVLARQLRIGDRLLAVGASSDRAAGTSPAPGGLVTTVNNATSSERTSVHTSTGTLTLPATAQVLIDRLDTVTPGGVLLVSRRPVLHAALVALGTPVVRRSPLQDEGKPAVTAAEWSSASLILVDGYLATHTLREMCQRPGILPRGGVALIATDAASPFLPAKAAALAVPTTFTLPEDEDLLRGLLVEATVAAAS